MLVCIISGCPVKSCPDGKCSHTVLGRVPQVGLSHSQVVPEVCRTGLCKSVGMVQVVTSHRQKCSGPKKSGGCPVDVKCSPGMSCVFLVLFCLKVGFCDVSNVVSK